MALPYNFQGGMFGAPQGYGMRQPMMGQRGGYGGGWGGMQKPAMLGGNTMAQNPMMNSRGGFMDNRGMYDNLSQGNGPMGYQLGGLGRGGDYGQRMSRPNWDTMGGAGGGGGAVSDPAGAFRPPSFSMGPQNPIQSTGGGMFGALGGAQGALGGAMSTPNMDQNPGSGAGAGASTGFTGIPPWGPNTPSPMPADGFGGARVGVPGGPPGSTGPNGQPYTQINTDPNYQQLGTSFGDKGAAEQMLTGLIGQYGRADGLARYRQFLDNQAMRSDSLGGGGEYAPINLNRGITYR